MFEQFKKTTASIYLSVSGSAARDAILRDLAARTLNKEDHEKFIELFKNVKSVRKRRNDVVHGFWGFDTSIPDALILQTIEDAVEYAINSPKILKCYIYKMTDFTNLIHDIQMLNGNLASFSPDPRSIVSPE